MSTPSPVADTQLLARLRGRPRAQWVPLLEEWIREEIAHFLGFDSLADVPARARLLDFGFDSMRALELKRRFEARLLCSLSSTIVFDHPTPESLADYLGREVLALANDPTLEPAIAADGEGAPGFADASHEELRLLLERATVRAGRLETQLRQPIAIIAAGCRMPGGIADLDAFWKLQLDGRDAITEVPVARGETWQWVGDEVAGARYGAFLSEIDRFDPLFFGISPREARELDPQQRILLEVTWQALEDAWIPPDSLFGSRTGVYLGTRGSEYFFTQTGLQPAAVGAYLGTGNSSSTAAGRISFTLGLRGPAVAMDTACSSSLVAVHCAVQALRRGECDAAFAGGVNLLLDPLASLTLGRANMLSPDGRCKTFDSAANGYVRGEGCGMVLLKPLAAALRDRDRIFGVILGSAINQDGAGGGLTVPNGPAQEAVIRAALADASVQPHHVGFIEAHGTGTELGDPIEIHALERVFGSDRFHGVPLGVGSIKTNIGHLEPAAGIAGLLRAMQILQHELIPSHLHLHTLNPHITWSDGVSRVAQAPFEWRRSGARRVVGVSSFGFSGTNAHVVLAEAPEAEPPRPSVERPAEVLPLSARSSSALVTLAAAYREQLAREDAASIGDLCYSAGAGRSHFEARAPLVVRDRLDALTQLERIADEGFDGIRRATGAPHLTFVFTGQGASYPGMGRELYATHPVFRSAIDRCLGFLARNHDLSRHPAALGCAENAVQTQVDLFSLQFALVELWKSWGVEPRVVVGHSLGEFAAACAAGVFDVEDALTLVARRAQLMTGLVPSGAMLAVDESWDAIQTTADMRADVCVAAFNGPKSIVLSGTEAAIAEAHEALKQRGISATRLDVGFGFHSALMDPMLSTFREVAERVRYSAPRLAVVSTVDPGGSLRIDSPEYWVEHIRRPVQFADAIDAIPVHAGEMFVEIGPAPHLLPLVRRRRKSPCVPSMRPPADAGTVLMNALAAVYGGGATIDWVAVHDGSGHRYVPVPRHPFEKTRHWYEPPPPDTRGGRRGSGHGPRLLGQPIRTALLEPDQHLFETTVAAQDPAFFGDHRVFGAIVFPAAGFLECVLSAGARVAGTEHVVAQSLTIQDPFIAAPDAAYALQVAVERGDDGTQAARVFSRQLDSGTVEWKHHATAVLSVGDDAPANDGQTLEDARAGCPETMGVTALYNVLHEAGLQYGERLQTVREIYRGDQCALGCIELTAAEGGDRHEFYVPPSLVDGGFQIAAAAVGPGSGRRWLPVGLERVRRHRPLPPRVWCRAESRPTGNERVLEVSLRFWNDAGDVLLDIDRLSLVSAESTRGRLADAAIDNLLYELRWRSEVRGPAAAGHADAAGRRSWLILGDRGPLTDDLAFRLSQRDDASMFVHRDQLDQFDPFAARSTLEGLYDDGEAPTDVVYLWALAEEAGTEAPATDAIDGDVLRHAVDIVKVLLERQANNPPALWLVTRGAQRAIDTDGLDGLAHSALWGFGAALSQEQRRLNCVRIDLDPGAPRDDSSALLDELLASDGESMVAFRAGERRVARLVRSASADRLERPPSPACELRAKDYGRLDHLHLRAYAPRVPAAGEVQVEVHAAALNFKDVLHVLGVLREFDRQMGIAAAVDRPLGFECAGTITAVGAGVDDLRVGDTVIVLTDGAMASHVTVRRSQVMPKPAQLTMTEAAGIQTSYLTALFALETLARVRPGERVLIHSAAGGVGQAAVQVARRAGATIYATASRGKWDFLKGSVDAVFDSRTTEFAQEILELTGGRGVDVVLNSLKAETVPASVDCLATGGRFVEIGKVGAWTPEQMSAQRPDVQYFQFDLTHVFNADDGVRDGLSRALERGLADRSLGALPTRTYPVEEAVSGFGWLASGTSIGKIVLEWRPPPLFYAEATYVITGGLGALGLITSEWIVGQGGRHLALLARHAPDAHARQRIDNLVARGAEVRVWQSDVAEAASLEAAFDAIDRDMPPVRGVIHAAGVLDDATVTEVEWERAEAVLRPKIAGGWNLHQVTRDRDLDLFVLFSSAASILGSMGQTIYSGANAWLDALAHHRRHAGLPAVSIDWGPWATAGMAATMNAKFVTRIRESGFELIAPDAGTGALETILRSGRPQVAVLPVSWGRLLARYPTPPRLLEDVAPERSGARSRAAITSRDELQACDSETRAARLRALLEDELVRALQLGAHARIEGDHDFARLGLDSLLALDLSNRLEEALRCPFPPTLLFTHTTLDSLTQHVLEQMFGGVETPAP